MAAAASKLLRNCIGAFATVAASSYCECKARIRFSSLGLALQTCCKNCCDSLCASSDRLRALQQAAAKPSTGRVASWRGIAERSANSGWSCTAKLALAGLPHITTDSPACICIPVPLQSLQHCCSWQLWFDQQGWSALTEWATSSCMVDARNDVM
jgi:hypothetical protein